MYLETAGDTAMLAASHLLIPDRRIVTAKIIYRLPDYPAILQEFIWQKKDEIHEIPELRKFLEFWSRNIEGKLHEVKYVYPGLARPQRLGYLAAGRDLRLH